MLKLISIIIFVWLLMKAIGLAFKLTWGMAKVIACILIAVALPLLIVCLIFAGGIVLFLPIAMVCIAVGILKPGHVP